ncbi:uncharacterized protein [Oscarella lobularis]|uniref:uncharacterized protein n=1 Tax=Oscarella lobularis TaxID=121494 RepID=UPI003313AABF
MPSDKWNKDSTLDVYRGQRYECAESIDIISPSSFVILQSRCSRMDNVSHIVWKDGIKLTKIAGSKVIECLITMSIKKGHHCIDVIVRWSSNDECDVTAKEFVDEVKSMIGAVCDERSPGVILNWFYLDSSNLKKLNADPAIYSSREVDQKVNERALNDKLFSVRPDKDNVCCVRDLVILARQIEFPSSGPFPADDVPVSDGLLKACAAVDGTQLDDICFYFDIKKDDRLEICQSTTGIAARRFEALSLWRKRADAPKVSRLLGLYKRMGVARRAIKDEYKQLCQRE